MDGVMVQDFQAGCPQRNDAPEGVMGDTWPTTPDGIRAFLDEHLQRLVSFAARKLGDYHEAEDAVQDVLMRLVGNSPATRINCSFNAYVYRSVANACIDRLRKRARMPLSLDDATSLPVSSMVSKWPRKFVLFPLASCLPCRTF